MEIQLRSCYNGIEDGVAKGGLNYDAKQNEVISVERAVERIAGI